MQAFCYTMNGLKHTVKGGEDGTKINKMKIEKKNIENAIETILAHSVMNGEEIDITTTLIMREIWKIIQYQQDQNKHLQAEVDSLKLEKDRWQYLYREEAEKMEKLREYFDLQQKDGLNDVDLRRLIEIEQELNTKK